MYNSEYKCKRNKICQKYYYIRIEYYYIRILFGINIFRNKYITMKCTREKVHLVNQQNFKTTSEIESRMVKVGWKYS